MEENFILLVEEKSAYVSQGKQKIGENKYTSLRKACVIISSGGIFPKYNYMFFIDTIKVVSLLQHIQENLQLKAGHLHNVAIAGHKIKYIPVYERCGKGIQGSFKEYQDATP